MIIPNKIDTSKLPDSFKKQICTYVNDLRQCVVDLKEENRILKLKLK